MPVRFWANMKAMVMASRITSGRPPVSRSRALALIPMVVKKYTSRMSRARSSNSTATPEPA